MESGKRGITLVRRSSRRFLKRHPMVTPGKMVGFIRDEMVAVGRHRSRALAANRTPSILARRFGQRNSRGGTGLAG
jgi:hypothetical protein